MRLTLGPIREVETPTLVYTRFTQGRTQGRTQGPRGPGNSGSCSSCGRAQGPPRPSPLASPRFAPSRPVQNAGRAPDRTKHAHPLLNARCPPPCARCWPAGFFGAGGCLPIRHGVGGFAANSPPPNPKRPTIRCSQMPQFKGLSGGRGKKRKKRSSPVSAIEVRWSSMREGTSRKTDETADRHSPTHRAVNK